MSKTVQRPGVRDGYDAWSATYDETPNPLVALDRRHTMDLLDPRPSEHILDAVCGTGAHLRMILHAGGSAFGLDLSRGMLRVARRRLPSVPLARADLDAPLPVRGRVFDAVLCALVGEHLENVPQLFREFSSSLVAGGRLIFSVFHPEMAAAGIEANFEREGVEYRLGAIRHRVDDYIDAVDRSGFENVRVHEFCGDEPLVDEIPWAAKYLRRPLLLAVAANKRNPDTV